MKKVNKETLIIGVSAAIIAVVLIAGVFNMAAEPAVDVIEEDIAYIMDMEIADSLFYTGEYESVILNGFGNSGITVYPSEHGVGIYTGAELEEDADIDTSDLSLDQFVEVTEDNTLVIDFSKYGEVLDAEDSLITQTYSIVTVPVGTDFIAEDGKDLFINGLESDITIDSRGQFYVYNNTGKLTVDGTNGLEDDMQIIQIENHIGDLDIKSTTSYVYINGVDGNLNYESTESGMLSVQYLTGDIDFTGVSGIYSIFTSLGDVNINLDENNAGAITNVIGDVTLAGTFDSTENELPNFLTLRGLSGDVVVEGTEDSSILPLKIIDSPGNISVTAENVNALVIGSDDVTINSTTGEVYTYEDMTFTENGTLAYNDYQLYFEATDAYSSSSILELFLSAMSYDSLESIISEIDSKYEGEEIEIDLTIEELEDYPLVVAPYDPEANHVCDDESCDHDHDHNCDDENCDHDHSCDDESCDHDHSCDDEDCDHDH